MTHPSKVKGNTFERECVNKAISAMQEKETNSKMVKTSRLL